MTHAKVQAVKACAAFTQWEAELKVEEACIAARLSALKCEIDVAAAKAEAQVLEAALEPESCRSSRCDPQNTQIAAQCTQDYVEQQAKLHDSDRNTLTATHQHVKM